MIDIIIVLIFILVFEIVLMNIKLKKSNKKSIQLDKSLTKLQHSYHYNGVTPICDNKTSDKKLFQEFKKITQELERTKIQFDIYKNQTEFELKNLGKKIPRTEAYEKNFENTAPITNTEILQTVQHTIMPF